MRARVPSGPRRLLRERSRVVAVALVALVAVSASGVQSAAALTLQQTLDANWRGAYDILVTATGATATLDDLLAPNSLASGKRLTLKQLDRVRSVAGVEVAAPIGEVLVPGLKSAITRVTLPKGGLGSDQSPQSYRVTATYMTNDGLSTRFVSESTMTIVVDNSETVHPVDFSQCPHLSVNDFDVDPKLYPTIAAQLCHQPDVTQNGVYGTSSDSSYALWTADDPADSTWHFDLESTPQTTTRVTLVDPVAEAQLLGKEGDFLAPLTSISPGATTGESDLDDWAKANSSRFATAYLEGSRDGGGSLPANYFLEMRALYAANGADFDESMAAESPPSPYVPLLVANSPVAPLTVQVKIESFGAVAPSPAENNEFPFRLAEKLTDGLPGSLIGTVDTDVSGNLNPFVSSPVTVPWPGTDFAPTDGVDNINSLSMSDIAESAGAALSITDNGATLHGAGFRASDFYANRDSPFALSPEGSTPGLESAYSGFGSATGGGKAPAVGVPVGDFPADLASELQAPLSYVPLGAYQPVASEIASGDHARALLQPSVSGLGLVSPRTIAIASINSAGAWGSTAPINAIRVRVSDVGSYSTRGRERVLSVAQRIRDLGLDATIVAGSSPSAVTVAVDDYAFGVSSAATQQTVGPLGDVIQAWSELGAASRADIAISGATFSVLALALGSVIFLLGSVQFASVSRRRSQAAIMREIGFTRGRVARWMAAEEVPGILLVVAAGIVASWISGFSTLSIVTATAAAIVVVVLAVASVGASASPRRVGRPMRRTARLGAVSPAGFGVRQVALHPANAISHFVAIAIVGLSTAAIALVILQAQADAGASLVAQLTLQQALVPQLFLAAAGVTAGITLAVIGRRTDLARRAAQWSALRSMGWTSADISRAQRRESVVVLVPAVIVAGLLTVLITEMVGAPAPLLVASVAVVSSLVAALILLFTRRKATA